MDIFGIGGPELLVILVVALVVLGPQRLPEVARNAGKMIYEFRRMSSEATSVFREAIDTVQTETTGLGTRALGEPLQPDGLPYPMDNTGIHPMFRQKPPAGVAPLQLTSTPAGEEVTPGYTAPVPADATPPALWYPAPGDANAPVVKKPGQADNALDYPAPGA